MKEEAQTGARTQEESQKGEILQNAGEYNVERKRKVNEGQRDTVFGTMYRTES